MRPFNKPYSMIFQTICSWTSFQVKGFYGDKNGNARLNKLKQESSYENSSTHLTVCQCDLRISKRIISYIVVTRPPFIKIIIEMGSKEYTWGNASYGSSLL